MKAPLLIADEAKSFAGNLAVSFHLHEFHGFLDFRWARLLRLLWSIFPFRRRLALALVLLRRLIWILLMLLPSLVPLLLALLHVELAALFAGWAVLLPRLLLARLLLRWLLLWLALLPLLPLLTSELSGRLMRRHFRRIHRAHDGVELRLLRGDRNPRRAEKCLHIARDI